jgi:hypothetical protein
MNIIELVFNVYPKKSTTAAAGSASLMQRVIISHCGPPIVSFINTNDSCDSSFGLILTCKLVKNLKHDSMEGFQRDRRRANEASHQT